MIKAILKTLQKEQTPRELGIQLKKGQTWHLMDKNTSKQSFYIYIEKVHENGTSYSGTNSYSGSVNMESSSHILDNPKFKLIKQK